MENKKVKISSNVQRVANDGKGRLKSSAKRLGVKSVFVIDDTVAINSFVEVNENNEKIPNLEKQTNLSGDETRRENYRALVKAEVDEQNVKVVGNLFDDQGNRMTSTSIMPNPAQKKGADYVGIKSKLEEKYFGQTFENDNVHVQIAYNVADIKKHVMHYIDQIIYVFYNINRTTKSDDYNHNLQDIIGMLYTFTDYDGLRDGELKKDEIKLLLKAVRYFDAYFPGVFKMAQKKEGQSNSDFEEEKRKCDYHNFDVLRQLSLIRQSVKHEKMGPVLAEKYLYALENTRGNRDFIQVLDEVYKSVPKKLNADFASNSKNNLYILSKVYKEYAERRLLERYYKYVVYKEQNNMGINLKLVREIIIDNHLTALRDNAYDNSRSKIYTMMGFVLSEELRDSAIVNDMIIKLRANNDADRRVSLYVHFAEKVWAKCSNKLKHLKVEFDKEKSNKFKGVFSDKSIKDSLNRDYVAGQKEVSCFSKEMLLMSQFLDGKEINELLTGLISKFNNIADLVKSAKNCGVTIVFKEEFKIFNHAREIAEELNLVKNLARMKPERNSISSIMIIEAANYLGVEQAVMNLPECTTEDEKEINARFLKRIYGESEENKNISASITAEEKVVNADALKRVHGGRGTNENKADHKLRNFIINNVVKSSRFFYVARYVKPSACRAIMKNEKIVEFVLKEIPDAQIARYHFSVTGLVPKDPNKAREVLKESLKHFSIDNVFDQVENMTKIENRSEADGSKKQMSRAIVRLYLTVAYLAVKGIVNTNAVFSIAFSCLERDLVLNGKDKNDFLAITKEVLLSDEEKIEDYKEKRDSIKDDNSLTKEKKKTKYKEELKPIQKKMHYDFHSYYAVKSNYDRATKLKVTRGRREIDFIVGYRNNIEHLSVPAKLSECLEDINNITSYYSIFVYCLQRLLIKEQLRYSQYEDSLKESVVEWDNETRCNGTYSKPMLWVMNAPFAYNLARYKNLSIEDLYYRYFGIKEDPQSFVEETPEISIGDLVNIENARQIAPNGDIIGKIQGTDKDVRIPASLTKGIDINEPICVEIYAFNEDAQIYKGCLPRKS